MLKLLRLTALFLVSTAAMAVSYGAGFATAQQRPDVTRSLGALLDGVRLPQVELAGSDSAGAADPAEVGDADETAETGSPSEPGNFGVFWETYEHVRADHYGPLPLDKDFTYGAIRGSMRALDDPYTAFSDPEITEIQRPDLSGEFEGIGAYVGTNDQGQLVIETPMSGQPAEQAGLRSGDIVVKVDDVDITGMDINEAVLLIRGPKGTVVRLTIVREDEPEPLVFDVERARIEVSSVDEVRLLVDEGAPEIGYLKITSFAADTKTELHDAIARLRGDGARALVVDLRNNPGGFLNTAIDVADTFIDEGIIVMQEDKHARRQQERADAGGAAVDLPLVVLVNGGSASASEIVAGAIRDNRRGLLVGEKTFGKGSVQNVHSLSDGSELRVTVAKWLTPNGSMIHKQGIEPDRSVEITTEDADAERDPQLETAIEEARALLEAQ